MTITNAPPSRSKRPLRTGRLGRLAGMAQAGVGLVRGSLSSDPIAPLERAAETLSELRGLATKAGQMAGIWSAMLPPAERARAEPVLARLRAATATSDPVAVRALLEQELGAPPGALFASFDEAPFASASLGQVHRARLFDADGGLEVAVKIQHPGIDVALRADLDNAARFGGIATLLAIPSAGAMVAEVRALMEEELDYEAEARWLQRFAAIVLGDPVLSVPRLVPSRSSRRVLTTELVHGLTVAEASRLPHAAAQARAVRRFVRDTWLEHGLLFADPHAGNWILHEDGRVTVLDFGCIARFGEEDRAGFRATLDALGRGDRATASGHVRALLGARDSSAAAPSIEMLLLALAPLASDVPVRAAQLAELARVGADAKKRMLGSRLALPTWLPMLLRALIGTMALLVELDGAD